MNMLVAARDFCPESPFCFTSTNKVYGDRPNTLPLVELDKRYDYAGGLDGVDESMSIDQCLHSVFGASKVAADVMCQEFGRYFQMPVGVFRGGCLTGPQHAAVELHGYLAYIVHCAATGKEYTIYGYKGKQVRDQIHSYDVARLFLEFFRAPRCGEVYNLGGGRANSLSILETIDALAAMGLKLRYTYKDMNRIGDHICYISDLRKLRAHFPNWKMQYDLPRILDEIAARHVAPRGYVGRHRELMTDEAFGGYSGPRRGGVNRADGRGRRHGSGAGSGFRLKSWWWMTAAAIRPQPASGK